MNLHFNPRRAVVYVSLSKCNVSRIQARFVLSGVTKASVEARTRDSARERDVRSRELRRAAGRSPAASRLPNTPVVARTPRVVGTKPMI